VKNAVIVDIEASTAVRQAEVTAAKRMIERVHNDLDLWPRKLIADTGYGAAEMLAWLVHERDIEPHIPVSTSQIEATVRFPAPTSSTFEVSEQHLDLFALTSRCKPFVFFRDGAGKIAIARAVRCPRRILRLDRLRAYAGSEQQLQGGTRASGPNSACGAHRLLQPQ
jgi:hypothetical protein